MLKWLASSTPSSPLKSSRSNPGREEVKYEEEEDHINKIKILAEIL